MVDRLVYRDGKLLRKESIITEDSSIRYREYDRAGELTMDREATAAEAVECMEYEQIQEMLARKREFMASPLGYLSLQDVLAWASGVSIQDVLQSLVMLAVILRDRSGLQGKVPEEQLVEVKTAEGGLINRLKSLIGR